jgi:hypothetical protein
MDLKLACPKCKAPLERTFAQISAGSSGVCTRCGEVLRFQGANVKVNVRVNVRRRRPWWKFWGA